jgi:hypothetical protein
VSNSTAAALASMVEVLETLEAVMTVEEISDEPW